MTTDVLDALRQVNATSAFNKWAGFELAVAQGGVPELRLASRPDLLQYSGFLHAGVIGAMIDTACGFAAASVAGNALASQYQMMCYAPAMGDVFSARARVTRAGKRQVFAIAELFAERAGVEKLVSGGSAVLMVAA